MATTDNAAPPPTEAAMTTRLEVVRQEFDYMKKLADDYGRSAFDDFKILGAVGAIVAWQPLATLFSGGRVDPTIVLIGFLGIALGAAIVGMYDLLKVSLAVFFRSQVLGYEGELRRLLHFEDPHLLNTSVNLAQWFRERHERIARWYYRLLFVAIVLFPFGVLLWIPAITHAFIYLVLALAFSIPPAHALSTLFPRRPGMRAREAEADSS